MPNSGDLNKRSILLSLLLLVSILLISGGAAVYVLADRGIEQAIRFVSAAVEIKQNYADIIDLDEAIIAARQEMFASLDRYSGYLDESEFARHQSEQSGSYEGVGILVISHPSGLGVVSVRKGGPGARAGLLSGDIIIAVDSVSLGQKTAVEAIRQLKGIEGSSVLVEVFRPELQDSIRIEVTRESIEFQHVPFAGVTLDSLLYVRLTGFDAGAAEAVEHALDSLLSFSQGRAHGLILDLTGNPGGLFAEALKVADLFLDDGTFIVGSNGRSRWRDETYSAEEPDKLSGLPMAVLVDNRSASAAEIVSGALQQAGRAILVGDTTFGKGLVQGFVRFPDGDGLRLTVSRYYFDGDVYLNDFDSALNEIGRGLIPDLFATTEDRHPFIRRLSGSFLLEQFAQIYHHDILAAKLSDRSADSLAASFRQYAADHGFIYISPLTEAASVLQSVAIYERSDSSIQTLADSLVAIADSADSDLFIRFAPIIVRRLKQLAITREHGESRAYQDIYLQHNNRVAIAAANLLGTTR
ncbi:MAG: S41 family peptidase [Candidatus Zixiibacteriota bacterium]